MDTKTKAWPTPYERETGSSWVTRYARPVEGDFRPGTLEQRQQEWDTANERHTRTVARTAEIRAEQEARDQEKREAAQAKAEARRETANGETEAMLRRRFVAAGGSEEEWAKEREAIIGDHRKRQVANAETADDRAKRAQSAMIRQTF